MFTDLIRSEKSRAGWYEARFIPSPKKLQVSCEVCSRQMWFPPSKAGKYRTCGGDCAAIDRLAGAAKRRGNCEACGELFTPRPVQLRDGGGRFCSLKCFSNSDRSRCEPDARKKAWETRRERIAEGVLTVKIGPDNPRWMGGKAASNKRRTESGKAAAALRAYRRANPEVAIAARDKRLDKKMGKRLPRGTVKRIGQLQRWFCPICREDLEWSGYHVDHITPLARGGLHESSNIQLLCPPCNVRKSAKDPLVFLQERGFLL